MTTRREIITNLYKNFEKDVSQITTKKLIPSLSETDLGLLLIDLEIYFPTQLDYRERISEMIELNDIELDNPTHYELVNICNKYLKEIKSLINRI